MTDNWTPPQRTFQKRRKASNKQGKIIMSILEDGTPDFIALELLVDRVGLRNVIYALSLIADHKADHIRSNWQDEALAKLWEHDARILDKVHTWTPV